MAFVSDALGVAGMLLQVIALVLLVRGPLSRYFPLFLYLLTWTAATMAEGWILRTEGPRSPQYFNVYWGGELLLDSLLFVLVVSLTLRALEGSPLRPKILRFFLLVGAAVILIPLAVFEHRIFSLRWNQNVAQLLNFGAAAMLLGLWSALVLARVRDRQLYLVSAGLGVTLAAAALTLGVRQFTQQDDLMRTVTDTFHRLTQIAGPAIWCWAFWPHKSPATRRPAEPATTAL